MKASIGRGLEYWKASLTAKAFTICFAAVHVPIIGLAAYLALGRPSNPPSVLVVTLLATLAGTGLSLFLIHRLLRPLHTVMTALRVRDEARVPELPVGRTDQIGKLGKELTLLIDSLEGTLEKLRRQAYSDPLTGLGNRRWLLDVASAEITRARRDGEPLSVIAFDLDHFKQINDRFGHDAGDEVLMAVAEIARQQLRPYDMLARIGGEEFCAVLPRASLDVASRVAERIRVAVATAKLPALPIDAITASFGVHQGDPAADTLKTMIAAADKNLYAAKHAGRNRVAARPATNGNSGQIASGGPVACADKRPISAAPTWSSAPAE
jgi:diguanylate cyclase (GGDEF)-like protein